MVVERQPGGASVQGSSAQAGGGPALECVGQRQPPGRSCEVAAALESTSDPGESVSGFALAEAGESGPGCGGGSSLLAGTASKQQLTGVRAAEIEAARVAARWWDWDKAGQGTMVKVDVKKEQNWKRTLEIELPPEQAQQQLEEVIDAFRKKVAVPGFRKGKVPRDVIERRFKDSIRGELYQKALPWAFQKAVEQEEMRPITRPTFEDVQYDEGGALKFKATVEVMPSIEIGGLDGLEIVGEVYEVGEGEVDAELEKIRGAQATFAEVDREGAKGDYLVVDYQRIDSETGEPRGEKTSDYTLELGASALLPEFAEALTGARAGESKRVDVSYPEEFANKELAGKKVSYHVEIKEIREKRLPDLDDKFARRVSEYATLEQLRARIGDSLRAEEAAASRRRLEEKLIDQLLSRHPFDAPDSLVESLGEQFVNSMAQGAELTDKEKQELKERYRPQVVRKVRRDLLLDLIADVEGIEVGDREVGLEIRRMKERGEVRPAVDEDELVERVRDRLRARKTIDMLMDRADVKLVSRPKEQGQGG